MRRKELLVIGLVLLMVSPVLFIGTPQMSVAANTVHWKEVDPPATSGKFISQVCADVNEDGHPDLIGGIDGLGIQVIAGSGDGKWTPLGAITTSGTYYGLDVGDVNNDGKLDVVAAEDGSGIYIWVGDGTGGWTLMEPPTVAGRYWSVALADVNGDGKLDIAAGSGDGDGLRVWTGDGTGTWLSASAGLPLAGEYADLALGDVDRDGKPDLVAASGLAVRAWQQAATWTERSDGLPENGDYYGVALADLDHDGDLDLVTSGDGVGVQAWSRGGETTWTWSNVSIGLPIDGQYWDVGIDDVNNDGDLDIAASSHGNGIRVWTGDGGGTWSDASPELPATGIFHRLTLSDFDDDGMVDLSAGHDAGLRAWLDAGTPDVLGGWNAIASPAREGSYQGLDVGDWNRDGKLDVVAASSDKGIRLWQGDGGNTWDDSADWTSPDLPTSGNYAAVQFGDIDHNGWLDVVAGSGADQGIRVWLFLDDVAWIEASGELPDSGAYFDVDLGDLNNDGYLDIAAVGKELGVAAWTAEDFDSSSPGWHDASFGLPGSGTFLGVAYADLNHDGCLDIVATSVGAGLGVWGGDCTGDWYARTTPTDSGTWQDVAVGDVNDDGQPDLVAASDSLGVEVWAGDGSFGWTPLPAPVAADKYAHVDLGDLNHDGKLDILASKTTGLEVWTGDGGTTWPPFSVNLPTTGSYPDAAFGEIDNDGVLDLIGAETNPGGVHAWTGAEGAPPSGWDNFSPTDWITETRKVDVSIQVQDTGSGLDVDSAEFAILEETGWSAWQHADCTGDKETTMPQTISAQDVTFSRDSGPYPHDRNQVRFRIQDMIGNLGYSGDYNVYIDTTPPTNPTDFTSSHPAAGGWQNDNTVDVDWDGAADESSGMEYGRYSYVFTTSCDLPVTIVDTAASMATSDPLDDGGWYISVRTRDTAGVWAPDAACDGPYRIDTQPPTNPTGFDASHDPEVWSNADTFSINWWGADDAGSGVFGYGWEWTEYPRTTPRLRKTTETSAIVEDLDEGDSWYFHVRAQDRADNWASDAVHWGPFYIDLTDPYFCWINPPTESDSSSFHVPWSCNDALSGVECYDVQVRDGAGGAWTDWQTCTTATSATYSGAQNGHTYYFRVRAHDRAGNVSDYLAEDHTLVLLPPGITGFTPTSGFASGGQDSLPLQLVPGTEVEITGSGLTDGIAYFNGVAMEPTRSRVINDFELRAMIGVDTPTGSGPICVRSPGGEDCSADDFEVADQPFPVRWGLGFDNFGTPASDMTWDIFERAFGSCSVNYCPIPMPFAPGRFVPCEWCPDRWLVRRPTASVFFDATRGVARGGDCFGLSYLTLDFLSGDVDPDDFASGADIPASLACSNPPTVCEASGLLIGIQARHWRQQSLEVGLTRRAAEDAYIRGGPMGVRDLIDAELDRGRWPMLCMSDWDNPDGSRGHCVNPYEVTANTIRIYDNNWSYIVHGTPAMERLIDVSDSGWSYGSWGDNSHFDRDNALRVYPYEVVDGPHTLPSDVERVIFGSSDAGHFRVEDAEGRVIGYDESGQYTNTMTSAVPLFPFQQDASVLEGYGLGEVGDYTVYASGTGAGDYNMTVFADGGSTLVLHNVLLAAGATDGVAFRLTETAGAARAAIADETDFVITTDEASKAASVTLYRSASGGNETRTYDLDNLAIGSGTPVSITTRSEADALIVGGGAGSIYDVCFQNLVEGGVPNEFCWSDINLQAGDRHILTPEDWDHLSSTRVRLDTDEGNDGSIDQSEWLVGHGLALTMESEPTVIESGDVLSYTLVYAVTGEETAPGVVLTTTVPLSATFQSATAGYTLEGDILSWTLGDVAPPSSGVVAFTVQVSSVPGDAVIGTLAYLRDESGRWAMSASASVGPDFTLTRVYLPIVLRNSGH